MTVDKFGYQVRDAVVFSGAKTAQDGGMFKRINHFQFALEAFILSRVAQHRLIGNFNRHFAAPDHVKGAVNIAHAPLGQVRLNLVLVELVADLQHLARNYSMVTHLFPLDWLFTKQTQPAAFFTGFIFKSLKAKTANADGDDRTVVIRFAGEGQLG